MAVSLFLFGGARLVDASGAPCEGRAGQRRRLAILAILAAGEGRPVPRERIVSLLWPDVETGRGRRSLAESLHVIHKELGEDPVLRPGDELALDVVCVRCDVVEFAAALKESRWNDAVALYAGPFLAGLAVQDAPDFSFWVDRERERLEAAFAGAVERLAGAYEAAGAWPDAAAAWRRLAGEKPESTPVALRLATALAAAGERAAALRHLQIHEGYLRQVIELDAPPELRALTESLRVSGCELAGATEGMVRSEPESAVVRHGGTGDVAEEPPVPEVSETRDEGASVLETRPHSAPWWGRAPRWAAAGALAALGTVMVWFGRGYSGPLPPDSPPLRVVVGECAPSAGEPRLAGICSGLMDLITVELSAVEAIHVMRSPAASGQPLPSTIADSLAGRFNARAILAGTLERSGGRVRHTLLLTDVAAGGRTYADTIEVPEGEAFALEETLARRASVLFRRWLGREVEVDRIRAGSGRRAARRLLVAAQGERHRAMVELADRDTISVMVGLRRLARVDTLLMRAEAADRGWVVPVLQRGWVAWARAQASPWGAQPTLLAAARGHAERALRRAPRDPAALELHGIVLWDLANRVEHRDSVDALVDGAARSAGAAVDLDPSRVTAWTTLSQVLRFQGRHEEAYYAALRARETDHFLERDKVVTARLFRGALHFGRFDLAVRHCVEGVRDHPEEWRFAECPLTLAAHVDTGAVDTVAAAALLRRLDAVDPPAALMRKGRNYARVHRRMLYAAVLARAGAGQRARAEMESARALLDTANEQEGISFLYDRAHVLLFMGQAAGAEQVLAELIRQRPQYRRFVESDYLFRPLREKERPVAVLPQRPPHESLRPVLRRIWGELEQPQPILCVSDDTGIDRTLRVHPFATRQVHDGYHPVFVLVAQQQGLVDGTDCGVVGHQELVHRRVAPEHRVVLGAVKTDLPSVI
jgi:DNA-binding SARP family transcriptional activator/TolB-like protein